MQFRGGGSSSAPSYPLMRNQSVWVIVCLSPEPAVTLQIGKIGGIGWHLRQNENEALLTSTAVPFSSLSGHDV